MEIETDRRVIKNRISLLKEELKKIDKQRQTQRKSRDQMVRVALVGYTNVGKSTIMNVFSKAGVKEENKLFATVDSTVRKVVINNIPFLLSDTVGFIRKLPQHLIESFKSTLDEVRDADMRRQRRVLPEWRRHHCRRWCRYRPPIGARISTSMPRPRPW